MLFSIDVKRGIAIYDFDGDELIDGTNYSGKWRYITGLPFSASRMQNSVASFDNYLVVVGENSENEKIIYYFNVDNEKWFNKDGEIPSSKYIAGGGSDENKYLCKNGLQ